MRFDGVSHQIFLQKRQKTENVLIFLFNLGKSFYTVPKSKIFFIFSEKEPFPENSEKIKFVCHWKVLCEIKHYIQILVELNYF